MIEPAGIGKTRLVEDVADTADVEVCWGAATDDVRMPALWPWTRAVRCLPGRAPITALRSGLVRTRYASAEDEAAATFVAESAAVDALAEHACAVPGLLIVLDNLQWADQATLPLLRRVAAEIRRLHSASTLPASSLPSVGSM